MPVRRSRPHDSAQRSVAVTSDALLRLIRDPLVPLVRHVVLPAALRCRYVRQEHPLWQELHAGTLTTSKLPGALGMREPAAARAIRGPQVGWEVWAVWAMWGHVHQSQGGLL